MEEPKRGAREYMPVRKKIKRFIGVFAEIDFRRDGKLGFVETNSGLAGAKLELAGRFVELALAKVAPHAWRLGFVEIGLDCGGVGLRSIEWQREFAVAGSSQVQIKLDWFEWPRGFIRGDLVR